MLSRFVAKVGLWSPAYWPRYSLSTTTTSMNTPITRKRTEKYRFPIIVERRLRSVYSYLNTDPLQVPSVEEINEWRRFIRVKNIHKAIEKAGTERLACAPEWVILYLLSVRVFTPTQAGDSVNLMLKHFPRADDAIKPFLIITAARCLAKQQVSLPIPTLVRDFVMLDLSAPEEKFNLLLRVLSNFRPTPDVAKAVAFLLDVMRGRQLKVGSHTYRALLSNKLVTLELAKRLQYTMQEEGFLPRASHLEAYLEVFSKHGVVHAAARYLNAIHGMRLRDGKLAPHGVRLREDCPVALQRSGSYVGRWNMKFLSSYYRDTDSALAYIRSLAKRDKHMRQYVIMPADWKRRQFAIWIILLHIASRDKSTGSKRFLSMFDSLRKELALPSTVVVLTVLMRGLVKKRDYDAAFSVWQRLTAISEWQRKIDLKALTVAVDVLVGVGRPVEAIDTVIDMTGIAHKNPSRSTRGRILPRSRLRSCVIKASCRHSIPVDPILVNALMRAFLRHGRPDVVYKLWDAYEPLFGVLPNVETLTTLVEAAVEGAHFDRSFRGLLEKLNLHKFLAPGRVILNYRSERTTRMDIFQDLRKIIQYAIPENIKSMTDDSSIANEADRQSAQKSSNVRKALWNNTLAGPQVRILFRMIILGNYPGLVKIEPPAHAVWSDAGYTAHPVRDALHSLGFGWSRGSSVENENRDEDKARQEEQDASGTLSPSGPMLIDPPLPLAPKSNSHVNESSSISYPQIRPDAKCFGAYIRLLGALGRASEVAETLMWMRSLDVEPYKGDLAIALILWAEASQRGPLLETYGPEGYSEYEKLHRWLTEWLGPEGLPTGAAMANAFERLKKQRTQ